MLGPLSMKAIFDFHEKNINHLIKWYQNNESEIRASCKKRGYPLAQPLIEKFIRLKKRTQRLLDDMFNMRKRGFNTKRSIALAKSLLNIQKSIILFLISGIPNILSDRVPMGLDSSSNVVLKSFFNSQKASKEEYNFRINPNRNKQVILEGALAVIENKLRLLFVTLSVKWGWELVLLPHVIEVSDLFLSGQMPNFERNLFLLRDEETVLIPTAEVAFVSCFKGLIEPKRYCAISQCFRNEPIAHGSRNKGLFRCHEFTKLENFSFTTARREKRDFHRILIQVSAILKMFKLNYRYLLLCSGDTSKTSSYTIDVEIFLPKSGSYMEISSISLCSNYQNRFNNIRYNSPEEARTVNGSCLPVGRFIQCLMEYYNIDEMSELVSKNMKMIVAELVDA